MGSLIGYSPWNDAASAMQGAGEGFGQALAQGPMRRAQVTQMMGLMQERQAHAGLYGAQTDQARAHTGLLEAQTQDQTAKNTSMPQIGAALSKFMTTGQMEPDEATHLFTGMALMAEKNPSLLANSFKTIAATLKSGMMTNQPMSQAVVVGNHAFGQPMNIPANALNVGTGGQPGAGPGMLNLPPGHAAFMPQPQGGFTPGPVAAAPMPAQHIGSVAAKAFEAKFGLAPTYPTMQPHEKAYVDQILQGVLPPPQQSAPMPAPVAPQVQGTNGLPPMPTLSPTNTPIRRFNPTTGKIE